MKRLIIDFIMTAIFLGFFIESLINNTNHSYLLGMAAFYIITRAFRVHKEIRRLEQFIK